MKKHIYIIANFLAIFALTSCESELNQIPLSQGTTENFYSTANDFIQARNAAYSYAFHGANEYGYANRILNLSEVRSDNFYATTQASRNWEGINNFTTALSTNPLIKEAYLSNYNAIYKANQLLEKLESNGTVISSETDRTTMKAEASFLRAFCYFDLIRWFGKVPLIKNTLTAGEVAKIGRTPITEIYDLILSDLLFAVDKLPPSYDNANFGRVTKYGAKGLLAQVYMTRSSPDYGIDGAMLGLNEWDKAYQQLNDIKTSTLFVFDTNYANIFKTEGNANKENVLVIPYTQNTGNGVGGNFQIELGYQPYFASLNLSDQGSLEYKPISTSFLAMFNTNDSRRAVTLAESYTVASGTYKGTYTSNPLVKKYIDASRYGNGRTDWGVDFIVIRYTDVLMLMAECTLHGGGGIQADVDDIVNDIRERGGLPRDAVNVTLDRLFDERRMEFFGEGTRWFDLIRSGNAITIMNNWKTIEDTAGKLGTIDKNSLLYPLPLSEFLAAPGLYTQNPGYDN